MTETRSDAETQAKVWEMVDKIETAIMVTMDDEGRFRGRPMQAAKREGDTLWFFTAAPTPKTAEVDDDGRVLLAYSDPGSQNYVSIYGTAEVVRDVAKQQALWTEPLRAWFPKGPEGAEVALLQVACSGAEYWDAPSSTLIHAWGYVKAITTGKSPQGGENAKVSLAG